MADSLPQTNMTALKCHNVRKMCTILKWNNYLPFLLASSYVVAILLALTLVFSVESIKHSTPFVRDILYLSFPLTDVSVPSYVFYSFLLFSLAPTSVVGCVIALLKFPIPRGFAVSFYTFQLIFGVLLLFMQDQSANRFDLEVELIESVMQYNRITNRDDAQKWDETHKNLKCCGYDNYQDWFVTPNEIRTNVPDSCCLVPIRKCGVDASKIDRIEEKIHTRGCYPVLSAQLMQIRLIYLSIVFIVLSIPLIVFIRKIRAWIEARRRQRD
ncbi:hypothetical protein GHT06_011807 [Daphnia sinensis]|uniref:Tetraspanin n=1 Tax=Daphnia sinensis TaxID=1820382 RepID=A0AAD5KUI4_9CRUS|nr:hypothetical protein GHT06_011807 [Daphnia sinensis]